MKGIVKINATLTEIACGHPNRKYLYVRQYGRYHYNSVGKPGVFDEVKLAESVNKWRWHRTTTGNSNMATNTGNSYTTGTVTDCVKISTASPGFSTMASPNKVSQVIATIIVNRKWRYGPQNQKYLYSLELWQIGWQLRRQIWGFRPRPAGRNWPRAISTTTDNRKWQYRRFGCQSGNYW